MEQFYYYYFFLWLHSAEQEQCKAIAGYRDTLGRLSEHLNSFVQSLEQRPQVWLTQNLCSFICRFIYVHIVILFLDPPQVTRPALDVASKTGNEFSDDHLSLSLQDEKRSVLKDVIPSVLISAGAHCGRHYWTSSTTRQQAHGQPVILYCTNGSCNNHTIVM